METFDLREWKGFIAAGGDPSTPACVSLITIDSRRIDRPDSLFVALKGRYTDGHQYVEIASRAGAHYALVRKNAPHFWAFSKTHLLRVDDPLTALQEIAAAYRRKLSCEVIAITGTHGKTMVKDLLHSLLSTQYITAASPESFNSQIGVALSLLTLKSTDKMAVIEAGISELDEMERLAAMIQPQHVIVTHVGKKHLTTLKTLENATLEFSKILNAPFRKGWALLPDAFPTCEGAYFWNQDNPLLPHAAGISHQQTLQIPYQIRFPQTLPFEDTMRAGYYYFLDLLNMTVKASWLAGIEKEAICEILRKYAPEPTRTEIWSAPTGTTFINDTYCSDPQSIDYALQTFDQMLPTGRKIFVFGGMRGAGENELKRVAQSLQSRPVDLLYLHGDFPKDALIDELRTSKTEITSTDTYEETLADLQRRMRPDDTVLIKGKRKESLDIITTHFMDSVCTNQCVINLAAIENNLKILRNQLNPSTRLMVIVKALAYGTDNVRIAKFLQTCGVDILGVSYVDEGVALKRAGVTQPIFVVNAAEYEIPKVVKWGLQVGVSSSSFLQALNREAALHHTLITVHLHVDTGMSRFGCRPEIALDLSREITASDHLRLDGIMTHFACADDPTHDDFTRQQASALEKVIQTIMEAGIELKWRHACNSAGALRFEFPAFNMVRIGLAVYGLSASQATRKALDLRMAISLLSRVVGINDCHKGDTISYGRSYTVKRERERIAVLPIGYFDGLHRNYSGKGYVMIRGHKAPMVGKICMDFMMVDVTDIPNVTIGDPVLIFGEDEFGHYLSPEELALKGDSIAHELITCLGPRIQRIFIYEENNKSTP